MRFVAWRYNSNQAWYTDNLTKVSTELPQDSVTDHQHHPGHTERVNQTPGVEGESVMQTTEGEEQDVKEANEHQDNQQTTDTTQNEMTNASFGFEGSNQNFQSNDWNANNFNPMMNMSNMQPGWGGFNNMMGMFFLHIYHVNNILTITQVCLWVRCPTCLVASAPAEWV